MEALDAGPKITTQLNPTWRISKQNNHFFLKDKDCVELSLADFLQILF